MKNGRTFGVEEFSGFYKSRPISGKARTLNDLSERMSVLVAELEEVKLEIDKLVAEMNKEKAEIGIGVFLDGTIKMANSDAVLLDIKSDNDIYEALISNSACQKLLLVEIETLAQVLTLIADWSSDYEIEVLFEDPKLQAVFDQIL